MIATAGALWRSLTHLAEQPLGYHRDRVLVVNVDPARAGYAYGELPPLYSVLLERLNAVPGVASVALSYYSPVQRLLLGISRWASPGTLPRRASVRARS